MPGEGRSEQLTEEQVRAKARTLWDEVMAWAESLKQPWRPDPSSPLAADDKLVQHMFVSYLARVSLAIGTEHMLTTLAYALNFRPNMFSMQTLLRTALIGGAQTLWLLSPSDQTTRVDRANRLSVDAYVYQQGWAHELKDLGGIGGVNPVELATLMANLTELTGGKTRPEVKVTSVIQDAANHLYPGPTEATARAECLAEWRHLSSAVHALPWNLNIRAEKESRQFEGEPATLYLSSWTQLQGAISHSYNFLRTGWKMLETQGAALDSET